MSTRTTRDMSTMPIDQVVQLPGGNGLASPAFQAPLNFLGIYGWQHVEQGVEALVCDGEVITKTRFSSDWLSAVGRRRYLRRVLLQPAPLQGIKATALTRDKFNVTLTVSVKYTVGDPVHVASLQDPITEISGALIGCASELARSMTLEGILGDTGEMRHDLQQRLGSEPGLAGWYHIVQVLSITAQGDERVLEVDRQRRVVEGERGLVNARGENDLIAAQYAAQITAGQARIEEMRADRAHAREMEKLTAEFAAQGQQALFAALGSVAAAGMDPGRLAEVFRSTPQIAAGQPAMAARKALPDGAELREDPARTDPVERERALLASIQTSGHIQSFDVFGSGGNLEGVIVQTGRYEVVMTCPTDYPSVPPEALVRYQDGTSFTPTVPWIVGVSESLAQVLLAVLPQADQNAKSHNKPGSGFGFAFDADVEGGN